VAGPAAAGDTTRVDARIDVGKRTVVGTVTVRVRNPAPWPLARAYVWLYPNRLSKRPAGINDVNFYWIYPRKFNPGAMTLTSVHAGRVAVAPGQVRPEVHASAGRRALWSIELPRAVPPGDEIEMTLRYRARIPDRYGPFGCVGRRCTLVGGFYPMLAAVDSGGWNLGVAPQRTDMTVSVKTRKPGAIVIFDHWFGNDVAGAAASATGVAYATVHLAPSFHRSSHTYGPSRVEVLTYEPPPPADDARGKVLPYTKENYPRFALETAEKAYALLDAVGARRRKGKVVVVEAPLRQRLAISQPRSILLSDRWYRIWPAKRFRKFHQRALVRELFAHHIARTQRSVEKAAELEPRADMIAAYLTDIFTLRHYEKREFADDILKPVSFVPAIDLLLYAPQTMFADAYFGRVLDNELLRDLPTRFMHQRPRGRLYYEKLRDLLTPSALGSLMRTLILERVPYREAATRAYGGSLGWFFRQWDRPYPHLNYKLVGTHSRRLGDGTYEHLITVAREVGPGEEGVIEPVEVMVHLAGNKRRLLRWEGRGNRATLRLRARERIARVVVDPRGRLVERKLPGHEQHPKFDNRDVHKLRFVYNSLGLLFNVSDLSALLAADFSLSRVRDLKHRLDVSLFTSAAVSVGLDLAYDYSFGDTVHQDRLLSSATVGLGARRLKAGFFSEQGASRLSLSAGVGSNNKLFIFEPLRAYSLGVGASLSLTRLDAGPSSGGEWLLSGVASAALARTVTPWDGHTFALNVRGAVAFGNLTARSQLVASGGVTGLRGFAPGELFSRGRLLARAEWRHSFIHTLNWNLGHYNFVHSIGGALFADAGVLTPCDSYDPLGKDAFYASVGYGLRSRYDSFGTMPQMVRLDVAVPITQHQRSCLGEPAGGFPPVMVYLAFLPPF
jgi:hypothetical protein